MTRKIVKRSIFFFIYFYILAPTISPVVPNYNIPSPSPPTSSTTKPTSCSNEKAKIDLDIDFQKFFPFQINEKMQFESKTPPPMSIGAAKQIIAEKDMDPTTLKVISYFFRIDIQSRFFETDSTMDSRKRTKSSSFVMFFINSNMA